MSSPSSHRRRPRTAPTGSTPRTAPVVKASSASSRRSSGSSSCAHLDARRRGHLDHARPRDAGQQAPVGGRRQQHARRAPGTGCRASSQKAVVVGVEDQRRRRRRRRSRPAPAGAGRPTCAAPIPPGTATRASSSAASKDGNTSASSTSATRTALPVLGRHVEAQPAQLGVGGRREHQIARVRRKRARPVKLAEAPLQAREVGIQLHRQPVEHEHGLEHPAVGIRQRAVHLHDLVIRSPGVCVHGVWGTPVSLPGSIICRVYQALTARASASNATAGTRSRPASPIFAACYRRHGSRELLRKLAARARSAAFSREEIVVLRKDLRDDHRDGVLRVAADRGAAAGRPSGAVRVQPRALRLQGQRPRRGRRGARLPRLRRLRRRRAGGLLLVGRPRHRAAAPRHRELRARDRAGRPGGLRLRLLPARGAPRRRQLVEFLHKVETRLRELGYETLWGYVVADNRPARWLYSMRGYRAGAQVAARRGCYEAHWPTRCRVRSRSSTQARESPWLSLRCSQMSVTTDVEQFILSELSQGRGITAIDPADNLLAKGIVDSHGVMELVALPRGALRHLGRRRGPHARRTSRASRASRSSSRASRTAGASESARMLMELLYENASARPDDVALVYRDERVTHADLVGPRRAAGRGPGRPGHRRRATPWRCCCRTTRRSWRATSRSPALGRRRRAGQPGLQAGRAGLLLPPVRRARGDQRRAQRRRLRADRGRLGASPRR